MNCKGALAALFNGDEGNINCGSDSSIDNIFYNGGTFSAWIRPSSDGENNYGYIATKEGFWVVHVREESGGNVKLKFSSQHTGTAGEWTTNSASVPLNTWTHIAVVYDSSETDENPLIYINRSAVAITENATPATYGSDAAGVLYLGNRNAANRTFAGDIADVRLFNTSLSGGNITTLGSATYVPDNAPGEYADSSNALGAVAWWKLNENNMPTDDAADSAGSNTGTVTIAKSNRITLTSSAGGSPSNYWNFYDHALDITADWTTFEKFHRYESGGSSTTIDINNCTIRNSLTNYYNWTIESNATVTSFTNNSIAVVGNYGFQNNKAHAAFDNITITGGSDRDVISSVKSEFTNSNFDITKVVLSNSSSHVVSKTHNDTENLYEVCAGSSGLSYSTITNTFGEDADVKLRTGILQMNQDNKVCDTFNVFAGATIRVADTNDLYVQGIFDNDGTWDQTTAGYTTGEIHIGSFSPFDSGDIIDNTDFVDTGFHDTTHYLEMDL